MWFQSRIDARLKTHVCTSALLPVAPHRTTQIILNRDEEFSRCRGPDGKTKQRSIVSRQFSDFEIGIGSPSQEPSEILKNLKVWKAESRKSRVVRLRAYPQRGQTLSGDETKNENSGLASEGSDPFGDRL
jgi:hypothetical protein